MAVVAASWITGGCERANPNYNPLCEQTTGMVRVTGGSFQMGANDLNETTKPVHTQTVAGVWMDETEVTVDAYERCVAAGACAPAVGMEYSKYCNSGVAGREQHPINCVDFYQAQAYCQWQCKRLPTEIEWEYAARGSPGSLYPWGNDLPNTGGKNETNLCWKMSDGTCKVKSNSQSSTLLGAVAGGGMFDLAGNVWEWTTSYYSCIYPLDKDKPTDPVRCGLITDMSFRVGKRCTSPVLE